MRKPLIEKASKTETVHLETFNGNQAQFNSQPPSPKKSWLLGMQGVCLGIGLGVGITLGGSALVSLREEPAPTQTTPAAVSPPVASPSVTVTSVKTASVEQTLEATGTVAAHELIPVLSQATGLQIQQVFVGEGDRVRAGQILAQLDDSIGRSQLAQAQAQVAQAEARLAELRAGSRQEDIAQAEAQVARIEAEVAQAASDLELAQTRLQRNQSLQAEGAIAQDLLDEITTQERNRRAILAQKQASLQEARQQLAELKAGNRPEVIAQGAAQLAEARARLQIVRADLKNTKIVAPVSGQIAQRNAAVGDTTTSFNRTPLFEIIEQGRLELRLQVPETQLSAIRPGQTVMVSARDNNQLQLQGKVREIQPTVSEVSRQALVKVDLSPQDGLKPGMFLQGSIIINTAISLTIPMAAVVPQIDGSSVVYVLQTDGSVRAQNVILGEILDSQEVEIKAGLNRGDRLVVKGAAFLKDGDRVTIQN